MRKSILEKAVSAWGICCVESRIGRNNGRLEYKQVREFLGSRNKFSRCSMERKCGLSGEQTT
jgi:hypothetical protein